MEHLNSVTSEQGAKSPASLTPLTDAAFFMGEVCDTWEADHRPELKGRLVHDMVLADFARKLEADRADLLQALETILKAIDGNRLTVGDCFQGRAAVEKAKKG